MFSPTLANTGGDNEDSKMSAKTHKSFRSALKFSITDIQLRYDLLSLSDEFQSMMLGSINELGKFEYPYNSYRSYESQLTDGTRQVIKISGTSGSVLESITFGFIQQSSTDAQSPSQSFFSSMKLQSYYFQIGGLRVPNRDIDCRESSNSNGTAAPYGVSVTGGGPSVNVTETEADAYVTLCTAQNIFKSYQVGIKGSSLKLVESIHQAPTIAQGYVGQNRRLYSYSFQQCYDSEVVSGFVLGDSSEISIVLSFAPGGPEANTRMYTVLNYAQKLIVDASGKVLNQL